MKKTACLVCFVLIIVACASSPTGRKQLILMSSTQMAQMGATAFSQMKTKSPPNKDPGVNAYVQCVSKALLKAAGQNPSQWEVRVFNDKSANAFALPGKKIGVHTGMIALAQTPSQLAAVIGHEIGHVEANHGSERVSMGMTAQMAQQLTSQLLEGSNLQGPTLAAIGLGAQFGVLLPYSRTHESEADYIGLQTMAKAGFDPQEAVTLWQLMAQKNQGRSAPEFLSTHPSPQTRIKQLSKHVRDGAAHLYQRSVKNKTCKKQI